MKIVKIDKETSKVSRKVLANFGEALYHCEDVESVLMRVKFKDGTSISFRRDEDDDDFQRLIDEDE